MTIRVSIIINGSMKGVPALSPLPRWGTTPGEGEFNLFSAPLNKKRVTLSQGVFRTAEEPLQAPTRNFSSEICGIGAFWREVSPPREQRQNAGIKD